MTLRIVVEIISETGGSTAIKSVADLVVFNTCEGDGVNEHYAVRGHASGTAIRRASLGLVKRTATAPLSLAARALYALGYMVAPVLRDTEIDRCEARFRDYIARELSLTEVDVEEAANEVFGKPKRKKANDGS